MPWETVYKGRRVSVEISQVSLPNGKTMTAERVVFPRVVSVLPVDSGEVYFIKQYRPALGIYTLEIPSGVVDEGESPEEAARRELEEEAGLRAGRLSKIFEGYVSPGYSTEYAYIYIATQLEKTAQVPEDYEIIEVVAVKLEEAKRMLISGEIKDMRASLALSLYLLK
ncbi:NUDIX domain-containing protein [Pyrobaculum arsenaticum]|uniref:NUDIX hydrolase n=1 Tax=Pyrobaculum arsenaticum (strain DSM 13514 / JCM 11321 / PZ6) TaxID=340102 RepID=A4WI96_PYRAR|nr:NUDIX hydrolase [Pyrobaculum arsenaticum]ABP50113.1 NUDIX hydrolase [Pyrobaculum arsenaticum DSM 13514]